MDDILSNLIVFAVLLVIGSGILFFVQHRSATQAAALEELAHRQGWTLEELRGPSMRGLRLAGRGWTLEAISASSGSEAGFGSGSVDSWTRFSADLPGDTVMLGPYTPAGGLRGRLLGAAARRFTDEDLVEVPLKDPALAERYLLLVKDPARGAAFLTPAAQAALLAWTGAPPLIRRDATGLEVLLRGERLKKPQNLLAFVQLGEALLG